MMNAFADKTGLSMMIARKNWPGATPVSCMSLMGTTLGVAAIVSNGTPEQQMEWVPQCYGTPDDIKLAAFARLRAGRRQRRLVTAHPRGLRRGQ